ncbi:MAG: branched-chain amino acid transport system permease protein [Streptosporangiaceae bacterium]|jgi:branched-chain amino acid transport system permease protein/neutral amino acid transport system permease protein|nr:branched-chain amino acid transport system permease protein [Streptosporangiaceae bacterium]
MNQFTLAIGFGLVTSAILALSAVGFTLQFGVSNIFNLAYGDVMTVSAFIAYVVDAAGAGIWLAMLAGAVTGAVVSVAISRLVFTPFLRRGTSRFTMVMVSLALAVILQNAIQVVAGTSFRSYAESQGHSLHFLGMILTPYQLVIIGVAAVSMLALHLLLRYTRIGKALRATAADPELARSCGIATDRVSAMAWAISGALCGLGGVTLALNLASFSFTFGNAFLLVIVAAAVFGSVGQPYGAMVGAVMIGMASELSAIWTPALKEVVAFVILVVILLVRPAGLWRKGFTAMDVAAR